ncbi:TadE/TadG family type IV pilus assembly protein [Blastopirellula marina]|uniref:TadE/TadG family type IV pilus assembly protein n=1 Tax=Blastopirellula marina TaxID=124 RepID=UPI0028F43F9F|nr:TadE/TadG family type IV pilus assembly protein [Blastopirellula marina]
MTPQKFRLHRPCRLYRSKRTGAAVVEFAIVAPLFFLLVFGMIEYGRMVMVQQVITNASREGARRAVLDGATTSEVVAAVEEFLEQASVSGGNLEIRVSPDPPGSASNGDPVGVTISVPFSDVSWMPSPMYLGGTTLEAKTVMRREGIK